MNQTVRTELLDRGLLDMLQLGEMAWVAQRHLGGSPSEPDVIQVTTEVISELLDSGYAIMAMWSRTKGFCVFARGSEFRGYGQADRGRVACPRGSSQQRRCGLARTH